MTDTDDLQMTWTVIEIRDDDGDWDRTPTGSFDSADEALDEGEKYARDHANEGAYGQREEEVRLNILIEVENDDGDTESRNIVVVLGPDHEYLIEEAGGDPECNHDWHSDDEFAGVRGHDGTTMSCVMRCRSCGVQRDETSYGSQRNRGQGDAVEYNMYWDTGTQALQDWNDGYADTQALIRRLELDRTIDADGYGIMRDAVKAAIKAAETEEIVSIIEAARCGADDLGLEIDNSDEGQQEEFDDSGQIWTIADRRLIVSGQVLVKWQVCVVSDYDADGEWTTEEDTQGGDGTPNWLEPILTALDLSVDLPEGAAEPDAPVEDKAGEWGVGYTSTDPCGDEPEAPAARYASRDEAEGAIAAYDRAMRQRYPGGWLAPHAVLMASDDEQWSIVEDDE